MAPDPTPHPTIPPPEGGLRAGVLRWFALLGGALAWTADIMLSYIIAEFGCIRGLHHITAWGLTLTAWLLIGLTLVTFAIAAAAAWVGYPRGRLGGLDAIDPAAHADHADAMDTTEGSPQSIAGAYLLRSGCVFSALFAVMILGQSIPLVFYLQRC